MNGACLIYFFAGLSLCLVLCVAFSKAAPWVGLIDKPDPTRKFHPKPTPMIGGIALWFTLSIFIYLKPEPSLSRWWAVISVMTLMGLIDDFWNCNAIWKISLQFTAALSFIFLYKIHSLFVAGSMIFFVVLFMNALNYMDNSNGVCAGVSLFILIGLKIVGAMPFNGFLSVILFGAIVGFLILNFPSGKIFLGDTGSHFLGALIACSLVDWNLPANHFAPTALFVSLPIIDMLQVTIGRIRRGQPFWKSDPYHLTHLLMRRGWSLKQSVLILWAMALITALLGSVITFLKIRA
jgi:UDP-GlcNAc:undecaprenyl-phosphate GlcNAc-1-phosphate transferase